MVSYPYPPISTSNHPLRTSPAVLSPPVLPSKSTPHHPRPQSPRNTNARRAHSAVSANMSPHGAEYAYVPGNGVVPSGFNERGARGPVSSCSEGLQVESEPSA